MRDTTPRPIDRTHLRAIALHAQGLDQTAGDDLAASLAATGFVRTLGGVDVYLAARARWPALRRSALDDAVARRALQILPTVRGCIYLVDAARARDSLALATQLSASRIARDHTKVGLDDAELERVARAVENVLEQAPATTAGLRKRLPEGTVRSLGDAGKKIGISSTLPPALRRLEFAGRIVRAPDGGRLDTERYLWRRAAEATTAEADDDPAARNARFANLYFLAAGVGTVAGFAAWSGLGKRDAKAAAATLSLEPVIVGSETETSWVHPDHAPLLDQPPAVADTVAFLPFEDNLVALGGGPARLVDTAHHDVPVAVWGRGKGTTLGDVRHSTLRTIVADGRLAGFWEFDPDTDAVVTACFHRPPAAVRDRIAREAETLGAFVRDELGHARSFSIDSEDKLRKRVAHLRGLVADGRAK